MMRIDTSNIWLERVITQDNKLLAFFSHKLLEAQYSHAVTEQELSSIVELLKEHRSMLLGQEIVTHADYLNLLNMNTLFVERV